MASTGDEARKKKLIAASAGLLVLAGVVLVWMWPREPARVMTVSPDPTPTVEVAEEDDGPKKVRDRKERPADHSRDSSKPGEPDKRKRRKQEKIPRPAPRAGLP